MDSNSDLTDIFTGIVWIGEERYFRDFESVAFVERKVEEGYMRQVSGRRQKTAYSGTDRIPFSLPKFFAETRREYLGE